MNTYPLLEKAPPHDSDAFIDYLRDNNVVVQEDESCIIIENCKYHTKETPWHTVFYKTRGMLQVAVLDLYGYSDWEWLKKAKKNQTVSRFHIHLIQR